MPSWPIEMPSDTAMVVNSIGKPPAARTPSLARLASRSSGMLHGVTSFHDDATADLGLVPVVVGHADGPQHRPGRRPLEAVGDLAAAGLHVESGSPWGQGTVAAHDGEAHTVAPDDRAAPDLCRSADRSTGSEPAYLEAADELGTALATSRHPPRLRWRLDGLMGALADACLAAGGEVTGVIPVGLFRREVGHTGLTAARSRSSRPARARSSHGRRPRRRLRRAALAASAPSRSWPTC